MPQVGESLGADPECRRFRQLAMSVGADRGRRPIDQLAQLVKACLEVDRGCHLLVRPSGEILEVDRGICRPESPAPEVGESPGAELVLALPIGVIPYAD